MRTVASANALAFFVPDLRDEIAFGGERTVVRIGAVMRWFDSLPVGRTRTGLSASQAVEIIRAALSI